MRSSPRTPGHPSAHRSSACMDRMAFTGCMRAARQPFPAGACRGPACAAAPPEARPSCCPAPRVAYRVVRRLFGFQARIHKAQHNFGLVQLGRIPLRCCKAASLGSVCNAPSQHSAASPHQPRSGTPAPLVHCFVICPYPGASKWHPAADRAPRARNPLKRYAGATLSPHSHPPYRFNKSLLSARACASSGSSFIAAS